MAEDSTTPHESKAQEIVQATLGLAGSERATYLDQSCAGDAALRDRVDELLERFEGKTRILLEGSRPESKPKSEPSRPRRSKPSFEGPGSVIGNYKILEKLGEGGFGIVLLADQVEPIRRRVALKIIKPGMDTQEVVARFEAERQALALMNHPHIARVLDGGTTDTGRAYFVMELVRGVPITECCDKEKLPTRERIELFIKVCMAVQYAHQKAIIHRDLKPSNILVTFENDELVPKIIDFGIAKALGGKLTEKTLHTGVGQMVGTPQFMSPEQAALSGIDVDTRTDIYALGVVLYLLLTGKTPLDSSQLRSANFDDLQRMIRDEEPVKPSTVLSGMGDAATEAAACRRTDVQGLTRAVRGDLDWIVMKALDKDRTRRYETPNEFATDLRRYLEDEPVLASPPSTPYRMGKFMRRHRAPLATAAAIGGVLVVAAFVSTWQAIVATRARGDAERLRGVAEIETERAVKAEQLSEERGRLIERNLYFAEMKLAAQAAAEPAGIARVLELTSHWSSPGPGGDLRGWEWYYLDSLTHRGRFTLSEHAGPVRSVAWSPDGSRLASAGGDGRILVWGAARGVQTVEMPSSRGRVNSVAWSPDGKRIASAREDKSVRIWNAASGKQVLAISNFAGPVLAVAWSPDGKRLAAAGGGAGNRTISIRNAATGAETLRLRGHRREVDALAWDPSGTRIASGSWDGTLRIWDAAAGNNLLSLEADPGRVFAVSWSPDGKRVASAGGDGTVRIWDAATGAEKLIIEGHVREVFSVAWSPDGALLASAGWDRTLRVWDSVTGELVYKLRGHTGQVDSVAWHRDGVRLASASEDTTVRIWDIVKDSETPTLHGHTDRVTGLSWSPTGKRLVSASWDETLRIWDVAKRELVRTLRGRTDRVSAVAWSPDAALVASASRDRIVRVWDSETGKPILPLRGHRDGVRDVAWSPDGARLASAGADSDVRIWNAATGVVVLKLTGHTGSALSVTWRPDGERFASAGADGNLVVWDAASEKSIFTQSHGDSVGEVAWSPDGAHLASACQDGTVRLWNAETGAAIATLEGHTDVVTTVAWHPGGTRLASGGGDNTVRIWDVATGQEILTLHGHTDRVRKIAWSPDGAHLASGGADNTIIIW